MGGSQARGRLGERGAEILQWTRSIRFYYICANMHRLHLRMQAPPIHTCVQSPLQGPVFSKNLFSLFFRQSIGATKLFLTVYSLFPNKATGCCHLMPWRVNYITIV